MGENTCRERECERNWNEDDSEEAGPIRSLWNHATTVPRCVPLDQNLAGDHHRRDRGRSDAPAVSALSLAAAPAVDLVLRAGDPRAHRGAPHRADKAGAVYSDEKGLIVSTGSDINPVITISEHVGAGIDDIKIIERFALELQVKQSGSSRRSRSKATPRLPDVAMKIVDLL